MPRIARISQRRLWWGLRWFMPAPDATRKREKVEMVYPLLSTP